METEKGRKTIGFVTSAFLPQKDPTSSFDFFAILTSQVLQHLQNEYDVVVRVPAPEEIGEIGRSQRTLLSELFNTSNSFHAYVVSPVDVSAVASVVVPFLRKHNPARLVTVDQSLGSSRLFRKGNVKVPRSVVPDNIHGGELAAESLWQYYQSFPENERLKRPKFIVVEGTGASSDRFDGFKRKIARLSNGKALVSPSGPLSFSRESASQWAREQLRDNMNAWNNVVGVFACNDELALGVCDALEWHLTRPTRQQMVTAAVVGFDGIRDVTGRIEKPDELWMLNTVIIPIDAIARRLREVVNQLFSKTDRPRPPVSEIMQCSLSKNIPQQRDFDTFRDRRKQWAKAFAIRLRPDVVAIPVKPEEGDAVLRRLKKQRQYDGIHRTYTIGKVPRNDNKELTVAVVRPLEQGVSNAQDTTRDAIEDLDPKLIALVGIGGARPAREYGLGDVIVCTRVHDLTMGAYIEDERTKLSTRQLTNLGGPMEKEVLNLIGTLNSQKKKLASWSSNKLVGGSQPKVFLDDKNFYGPEKYKTKVKEIFESRFGKGARKKRPDFYVGSIASDGNLVKDTSIIKKWMEVAREFVAIDMELPGVYIATNRRGKHYPILAIRGISDVVGFERDHAWTQYACETAASFFIQLLRLHPGFSPQSQFFSRR